MRHKECEKNSKMLLILEEPPPGTYIFLITTRTLILPTIAVVACCVRFILKDLIQSSSNGRTGLTMNPRISCLADREKLNKTAFSNVHGVWFN